MALRAITADNPPTRKTVWKMLGEAVGYFYGGIKLAEISTTYKFAEAQIKFSSLGGHSHNGTAGSTLSTSAIDQRNFDHNNCQVAWGRFFGNKIAGSDVFAVLSGKGLCALSSATAFSESEFLVGGTCTIDYNPYAAAPGGCTLDIRGATTWYDTAAPYNTNWTILHAHPTMVSTSDFSAMTAVNKMIFNHFWSGSTTPYFYFAAHRYGTSTTLSDYYGTAYFDYFVVIKKL